MRKTKLQKSKKLLMISGILLVFITLALGISTLSQKEAYFSDGILTAQEITSVIEQHKIANYISYDNRDLEDVRYLQIIHDSNYPRRPWKYNSRANY